MLDPTDSDDLLPPAQPAEQIPAWLEDQRPEGESSPASTDANPDTPTAETLAERHKARRQASRRLSLLTGEAPVEPPTPAEEIVGATPTVGAQHAAPLPTAPVETQYLASPDQTQYLASPDQTQDVASLPDTATPTASPQETLLQYVRAWPRRVWQQAGSLWARIARREPTAPGEPESPEAQEISQPGGPGDQPPLPGRFKAGAARAWTYSRPILWRGRIGPAFWTVASLFSLTVNIILIVILILLGRQLFFLKKTVISDKLINGLYDNFTLMDQAHIQTTITVSDTIQVKDTIPVVFDLPLNQKTTVVLTKDTPVNTTIYLNNAAVPLDLVLREGTELNIKLDMIVPVNQSIPVVLNVPVNLKVPVDIPLDQTQLHKPFVGLQHVVSPFRQLLGEVPDSWGTVCTGPLKFVCTVFRFK